MKYRNLRKMTKAQIVAFLIPLIDSAVKINESWVDGNKGIHPLDPEFDSMAATSESWSALVDLHDDYGDEP